MNIQDSIDSMARVENAGGVYTLVFPYTSTIGNETEELSVRVPIKHEQPSPGDKKALVEAVTVQGGLGTWSQDADGRVRLVPTA